MCGDLIILNSMNFLNYKVSQLDLQSTVFKKKLFVVEKIQVLYYNHLVDFKYSKYRIYEN